MVFQGYALFPHLTVAATSPYGLRMRGSAARRDRAAGRGCARDCRADAGSRTATRRSSRAASSSAWLSRARWCCEPRVLLLDEPFTALDAKLRAAMQVELRAHPARDRHHLVFVTHDQEEALTISDRIAVMRGGRIEQAAPPKRCSTARPAPTSPTSSGRRTSGRRAPKAAAWRCRTGSSWRPISGAR